MFLDAVRHIFYLLILSFFQSVLSRNVFAATDVFYSQNCNIGFFTPGTYTIACLADAPQKDIIRIGLALAEFSKPPGTIIRFSASVATPSNPASSFTVTLFYGNPIAGMKMGFFIVVIKAQSAQLFVDLIEYYWGSGTTLDTTENFPRSQTQSKNVLTSTIFTSGTSGLVMIPFISFYRFWVMDPVTFQSLGAVNLQFEITTALVNPNLDITLSIKSKNKLQQFGGFVLLLNPSQIAISFNNGFNIEYQNIAFTMGQNYDLTTQVNEYGPNFNSKCLLGFYHFKYKGDNFFNYQFADTALGNYSVYKQMNNTAAQMEGNLFCFGNSTQCAQGSTYIDPIDTLCYTPSTCPLPVPAGWTQTDICPSCTQLICENCTVSNRSECLKCMDDSNSHLNSINKKCQCDIHYYEQTFPISTAAQGDWNNLTPSLLNCLLNCTSVIVGCKLTNCTNSSFCVECFTGYFVDIIDASNQKCTLCNVPISNCTTCTNGDFCTDCEDGAYLYEVYTGSILTGRTCPLCRMVMPNCIKCDNYSTCLSCTTGYIVNSTTKKCQCDPSYNNLFQCIQCFFPTSCTECNLNFYVNTTLGQCQPCSNIDQCTSCQNENTCQSCNIGWTLDSNSFNNNNRIICSKCSDLINNCGECQQISNTNYTKVCLNCDLYYGVNKDGKCERCNVIVMNGCLTCQDQFTCLSCDNETHFINSTCHYCSQIYQCLDCQVNLISLTLQCTVCQKGYTIQKVGQQLMCVPCRNVIDNCFQCTSLSNCASCVYPYVLSIKTKMCDQCALGYRFWGGYCMKYPGCSNTINVCSNSINASSIYQPITITQKNSSACQQLCLACIQELHFHYDQTTKSCLCNYGYSPFYQLDNAKWVICEPVCGDSIVLSYYQQCDDGNSDNLDGCNIKCQIEKDFQCSNQPSHCILYLSIESIKLQYIYRAPNSNKATLMYSIFPKHQSFPKINWVQFIALNFSTHAVDIKNIQISYSSEIQMLEISIIYKQQLQNSFVQIQLDLDPSIIVSSPTNIKQTSKLNGVNLPLIFENQNMEIFRNSLQVINLIVTVLSLLLFYIGSFVHKMIGLQTIQTLQVLFFSKLIVNPQFTTILHSSASFNTFSAPGLTNLKNFLSNQKSLKNEANLVVQKQFLSIQMPTYFILNANLFLIPLLIMSVSYIFLLIKKYRQKNVYIQTLQNNQKQAFVKVRNLCERVYSNFIFPYLMMFNLISFFFLILSELTQPVQQQNMSASFSLDFFQSISFSFHSLIFLSTALFFIMQLWNSYKTYYFYRLSKAQLLQIPRSLRQNLQLDKDCLDSLDYHPFYIFAYLTYYLLMEFFITVGIVFNSINLGLQLTLVVSFIYLIGISCWKPYLQSTNIHNKFLKLNHFTTVICLIFYQVFDKSKFLSENSFIALAYIISGLQVLVVLGGFYRIYFQIKLKKPRNKQSQQDQSQDQIKIKIYQENIQILQRQKLSNLLANNKYSFSNQLKQLRSQYMLDHDSEGFKINKNKPLTSKQEEIIVKKIREDYKKKKNKLALVQQQNILSQQCIQVKQQNTKRIFKKQGFGTESSSNLCKDLQKINRQNAYKIISQEHSRVPQNLLIQQNSLQGQHSLYDQNFFINQKTSAGEVKQKNMKQINQDNQKQWKKQKSKAEKDDLQVLKKKMRYQWKMMHK